MATKKLPLVPDGPDIHPKKPGDDSGTVSNDLHSRGLNTGESEDNQFHITGGVPTSQQGPDLQPVTDAADFKFEAEALQDQLNDQQLDGSGGVPRTEAGNLTPTSISIPDGGSVFEDAGAKEGPFIHPPQPPGEDEGDVPIIPPTDGGQGPTTDDLLDMLNDPKLTDEQRKAVRDRLMQNFNDPTKTITDLGVEQTFTPLEAALNEFTDPNKFAVEQGASASAGSVSVTEAQAAADVAVKDFEASLIDLDTLKSNLGELAKQQPMEATSITKHMNKLLEGMEEGSVPLWARPAVTKVEQALASRGISASSIGRDSLFNAIISAAFPIAQGDAQLEHDANKVNYNAKISAMMADVSQEFAAKQFNASTINQKNQFMTQLTAQVDMQNASRKDAMAQFNADAKNKASIASAQMATQVSIANAQMDNQRMQFNAQMASAIEQSNVQWRRQINQINTAGVNAVNQANAQNAFNLSNQAQTALWQEMRDEAHWAFQANETEKARQMQLELTILQNEALAAQGEHAAAQTEISKRLYNRVLESAVNKLGTWVDGLWDSGSTGG